MEKTCAKCKISKPFEEFSKASTPKSGDKLGLRSRCKKCRSEDNLSYNQKRPLQTKANSKIWYEENSDWAKFRAMEWREANKERHSTNNKTWKANNLAKNTANAARYKARKLKATPAWVDAIQMAKIEEFYDIAACKTMQTGIPHHVDHIVPLKGEMVSGLHVPWNLQVLTARENISKKNKILEEFL